MKAKRTLFLLVVLALMTSKVSANEDNQNQEEVSSDFLEFLADMEEVTGDGFENWLDSDTEDDTSNEYE